jgi:hypothetical protein
MASGRWRLNNYRSMHMNYEPLIKNWPHLSHIYWGIVIIHVYKKKCIPILFVCEVERTVELFIACAQCNFWFQCHHPVIIVYNKSHPSVTRG